MNTITAQQLKEKLNDPSLQLIDVRTPVEFNQVHIETAINVPLDQLSPTKMFQQGALKADSPVHILCHSGQRACRAAEQFLKEGFSNIIVVEGGTVACLKQNLACKKGDSNVISLERQVRVAAGLLVLTGVLLGLLIDRAFFGISAFVGAGLIFAGITDWCGMGLLLARAPWNR